MKFKTLPIFLAFLMMGVADAMGPLSDAVRTKFQLSTFMATLMPLFLLIAFAIFSVSRDVWAERISKRKVLLANLRFNTLAVVMPDPMSPIQCWRFLSGSHEISA